MATHTENRAVCYQRFYPTDDTLTDKTPDREDTEVLWGKEVQENAKEKGYVLPKLAEGIFYNEDKTITFVTYQDSSLRMYDTASGELLAEITDTPGDASEYYGKDAQGNYYVGFGSWAYMMSPGNENLAFLRGMAQIDESGKLLTTDNLDNYYLCPVYTLDELLAMAEADVVKYTQSEITE